MGTTAPAREAFARACARVAVAVVAQTTREERDLVPLFVQLPVAEWRTVTTAVRSRLSPRERLLVLGFALEGRRPVSGSA